MSQQDAFSQSASSPIRSNSDVPSALLYPSPGDYMVGLNDRVDRDERPPRAFYLIELVTPVLDPSEVKALKGLVGINARTKFRLKRASIAIVLVASCHLMFTSNSSRRLSLLTCKMLTISEESSTQLHHSVGGCPKVMRLLHSSATSVSGEGTIPSSVTLPPVQDDDDSDVGGASYLSMTYDVDSKQFICRRHFHDGSVMDYGRTALVCPGLAQNSPM